jgi:nephrocystin-3
MANDSPATRQIRIFISSTFLDMKVERDYLVKFIFPQLRKLCAQRQVVLGEVDLRWGVTDEQAAEGKVLPICLEEIKRCRPYFIGLLGERYGWVPDAIPQEVIEQETWLEQHVNSGESVTELEILHGVLNNPDMTNHAFFYFRDSDYLNHLPVNSDLHDFISETPEARDKLTALKMKIIASGFPVHQDYPDPKTLGELVLQDLTELIEKLYPEGSEPAPLNREAMDHAAYAQNRRIAFVGRKDLLLRLDIYATNGGMPFVLTGEPGCGKSALLAEWVAQWTMVHPNDLVIQHYIGSTHSSSDWQGLVSRLLNEIKHAFNLSEKIPVQSEALRNALLEWTPKVAGPRRIIVVLDGLNQLVDDGSARQLSWLPVAFPSNCRVLVSTLTGESLAALEKRGWSKLIVPLFDRTEVASAAHAYLIQFGKTPSPQLVATLESTPAACNPFFLRVVLDELRQFGDHEKLQAKSADYTSAVDLPDLFNRVLTRWDQDYGAFTGYLGIVQRALCLIACSRFGLTEMELLILLGSNGMPLPHRVWSAFYFALETAFVNRTGLLNFSHDSLRIAVVAKWLQENGSKQSYYLELASYFRDHSEFRDRHCDELPELLCALNEWDELRNMIVDIPTFLHFRLTERWKCDLHKLWQRIPDQCHKKLVLSENIEKYLALKHSKDHVVFVLTQCAAYYMETAEYDNAEKLFQRALTFEEESWGSSHPRLVGPLCNLAWLLGNTYRLEEGASMLERAIDIAQRFPDETEFELSVPLIAYSKVLHAQGYYKLAERFARRALELDSPVYGNNHWRIAIDLLGLSMILRELGHLEDSESMSSRAIGINEATFGPEHPEVAIALNEHAYTLFEMNRHDEAIVLLRHSLQINRSVLGVSHPRVAGDMNDIANILTQRIGETDSSECFNEVESMLREAISIDENALGTIHPFVARDFGTLAVLYSRTKRFPDAISCLEKAIAIDLHSYGEMHPTVALRYSNYGVLLREAGNLEQAAQSLKRAIEIYKNCTCENLRVFAAALGNLALVLNDLGRSNEAEIALRQSVEVYDRLPQSFLNESIATRTILAGQLLEKNRQPEAISLLLPLLEFDQSAFTGSTTLLASMLTLLAGQLQSMGQLSQSEKAFRIALIILEQVPEQDTTKLATALDNLGQLLFQSGRIEEAASLVRRELEVLLAIESHTEEGVNSINEVLVRYMALLIQTGKDEMSAKTQLNAVLAPFGLSIG